MNHRPPLSRALCLTASLAVLASCSPGALPLDWDLRGRAGAFTTADAARGAGARRPAPDARGIISYPTYQVAVAQRGDTIASLSTRLGLRPQEVASYNALNPQAPLRPGELVALPSRVAAAPAMEAAPDMAAPSGPARGVDVSAIATTALDRAAPASPAPQATPAPAPAARPATEPNRHRVAKGETAYSIARNYNVPVTSLAEWNGLGANLNLREGQVLIIPAASGTPPATAVAAAAPAARTPVEVPAPGAGSPTPLPPSASKPLPTEKTTPAAAKPSGEPASPNLASQRTAASASRLGYPAQGSIIRGYVKKKNDGVDIGAAPGTPVKASADGTVAAITQDTDQVPILVIRHPDNLLTVYANIDGIKVTKGASVKRGQQIAVVRAGSPSFVHFEVRKGFDSVDPMPYLQ